MSIELNIQVSRYQAKQTAIAVCDYLVAKALRSVEGYDAAPDFFDKMIAILKRGPACGSFRHRVVLENGRSVTYCVAWASGYGSSLTAQRYVATFKEPVPGWVMRRHPYKVLALCLLALEEGRPLPSLSDRF